MEGVPVAEAATAAFEDGLAEAISSETGDYTTDNSTVLVRLFINARRCLLRYGCALSFFLGSCCKDYPGLSNRSVFYPYSSGGNTITFDVVYVAGSNLTPNVYFIETLARAYKHISLVPRVMKRSG